ncbi:unnamed protein product [Symbiodinium sp. CCMP2592]|nr:unnamed protein product [Symbiodinium sp. CCMP2592]
MASAGSSPPALAEDPSPPSTQDAFIDAIDAAFSDKERECVDLFPPQGATEDEEQERLASRRQMVISAMSVMESTDDSFIRAAPAWAVLCWFGLALRRRKLDPNHLYSMSSQVDSIDEFWSHSWHCSGLLKVWLLLMLKNGRAACLGGTLVAVLVAYLSYADLLPGWYKEPRIQGPGYSGEFRFSPWSNLSGCASAVLLLIFWQSSSKVFLDRACIHQGNARLKAEGILNLGALLKKSRTLVVVWDPSYLSRLWCVFELAAFLHGHREELQTSLIIKPTVLVPMSFIMTTTVALMLLFETCLPETREVAFLRIFLFAVMQVPELYLFQKLWKTVMDAEKQFGSFTWQNVTCRCCSINHRDPKGNVIICDREILEECIVQWYGSVNQLELSVRSDVRNAFIEQVTRFPLGYQWLVGVHIVILWGQLDPVAAGAHGGAYSFAASKMIVTIAWLLWIVPVHYIFVFRVSHWMATCQSRPLRMRICAACAGCAVIEVLSAAPHVLQAALYQAMPEEPLIAAGTFLVVTLCLAAVGRHVLTRSWKGGPETVSQK